MDNRLTGAAAAEPERPVVRPALLVELRFLSETVRCWSGIGHLVWNGVSWTGTGTFGKASQVEETLELRAAGAQFELSGIPPHLIVEVMAEPLQGRPVRMWLAFFAEDFTLIPDPVLLFAGRMDSAEIVDSGDSATVTVAAENQLRDLERARIRRYTDADQQAEFPGDRGFEFVPSLQETTILWGRNG